METFVALLIFGSLIPSTNYYVNQEIGSDSNSGTSVTAPFLTVAKLLTVLTCGQSAAIYGGSSAQLKYREQFTGSVCSDSNRQSLVGYGNFQPLLDASEVIASGSFTKTVGRTNIYQADVVFNANGFARAWEDNLSLLRRSSLTQLDSMVGYFIVSDPSLSTPSTLTLYIHATGDDNPASNGKVYEYNKRTAGVFSQSRMTVSNVYTRRQLSNNGSLEVGPNSFITNLTANDGTKHNALIHKGTTIRYCSLNDSYYDGQGKIALVLNDNAPTGEDAWIESCIYTEALETGGAGFYGHVNSSGNYGTVTCKNCGTGVGVASAISGFLSDRMLIDGGTFASGSISAGSSFNIIKNITLNNQIALAYPDDTEIDNIVISCLCTNGLISIGNNVTTPRLSISNSTFTNTKVFDGTIYFGSGSIQTSLSLINNVFNATVQTSHYFGPGNANLSLSSTINNNIYHYSAAPTALFFHGVTYNINNLSQWNAWLALGFDSTGSRVTP